MAAQAVTRLTSTIGSLPGDVTKTGATFENLGIRLETLEGSADKAKEALAWVQQFAKDTPLGLADTADAYAQLKNYGIDPTNGSLMALTDAMAASGKGTQQLGRLSLALGQAWVKQKLQGGEILQLTEAGIPVWDMLATATGKNVTELQKLSQAGKLGRTEIQLLINEIGRKYAGASEKMARTYDGLIDKLGDAYQQFQLMISDAGWFDFVKKNLDELEQKFSDFLETKEAKEWARTISNVMVGAAQAAMRLGRAVLRVGGWIGKGFDAIGQAIGD
ncbi:MAG: tape measure protein, partial [Rhizobiaceae bacterium]|nr:tape measure protein [Rhizobiaceae bacterium]